MANDDAAAAQRFPGPDYYEVLRWLHACLRPQAYLEIGVMNGCSLDAALPGTLAIGVDPAPQSAGERRADRRLFPMTSSDFFNQSDLAAILGGKPLSLALIDGLHCFEQALEDLLNVARYTEPDGVIAIHDTVPLDRRTAERVRTTEFYSGDVWKIVPFLRTCLPEVKLVTVATAPTGLTLVRGLRALSATTPLLARAPEFARLDFDYFEQNGAAFLNLIPNHRALVEGFCQKTPVQSIRSSVMAPPSL